MDVVGEEFLGQSFDSEAPGRYALERFNRTLTAPRLIDIRVGLCSGSVQRDLRVRAEC
ncbi:hypothetical protein [Steroidobacter agaridevorans]|uniref:hypothetical protein n=1 Tax=Steroidobacter agaridevorans TaxID=2695856 RepID=UPI001FCB2697|nr:hypothetical protein [Steroidobacter agaridevorans]